MKTGLNISIESELLQQIKSYAVRKNKSISGIIEDYFIQLIFKEVKKESILDFLQKVNPGKYPEKFDFKSAYHTLLEERQED